MLKSAAHAQSRLIQRNSKQARNDTRRASLRALEDHLLSRRESVPDEPSLRIFFRARFRANALFTLRFSPGFK